MLDGFFQSRTVSHDVAEGCGLAESGGNFEINIGVNVPVEIQFALFDELHHAGPGKELGDRTRAEESVFRRNWNFLFVIRIAIALGKKRFAVLYDSDDRTGNVRVFELERHQAV